MAASCCFLFVVCFSFFLSSFFPFNMSLFREWLCLCLLFSLPLSLLCSSCPSLELTGTSGSIKHPIEGNYQPDETCEWRIVPLEAEEGSKVVVYLSLDLVEREENSDYLEIIDGIDELYGKTLAVLTGNQPPPPIMASGETMYIKFRSTGVDNQTAGGFELQYSITACEDDCGGNGYCFDKKCHCDPGFSGKTCAETNCPPSDDICGGKSRGECVTATKTEKKCDCQPGFYGGDCMAPRCSGVAKFTKPSGNFTDHHQEGIMNYNSNALCQWVIYAPPPPPPSSRHTLSFIQLHFNRFSTQFEKDWVHVYDSETPEVSSLLGSFSGDALPVDLLSSTGVMLVTFETDIGVEYEGFECSYDVYERDIGPAIAPHEGKTVAAAFATFTFFLGIVIGVVYALYAETARELIRIYW